jgi:hypothetical protein
MVGVGLVWGVMRLCGRIVYCGLIRIMDFFCVVFFLYNHNRFLKVMDAIIFQRVHKFIFFMRNVVRS